MSLCKSPALTPALLAAHRRNTQISTGPRKATFQAGMSLKMKEVNDGSTRSAGFQPAMTLIGAGVGKTPAPQMRSFQAGMLLKPKESGVAAKTESHSGPSSPGEVDANRTFQPGMSLKTNIAIGH